MEEDGAFPVDTGGVTTEVESSACSFLIRGI